MRHVGKYQKRQLTISANLCNEMIDPVTGIAALKTLFEALKAAIGLAKEAKNVLPEGPKKEAFDKAIVEVQTSAEQFNVELAKEWGYPLCRCTFPPQIMLQTDHSGHEQHMGMFECPKCGESVFW